MDDLHLWSLTQLAGALRAGDLSASEVAEHFLARCQTHAGLDAFVQLDPDAVREKARRLDSSPTLGPLHGLPFAVKDNIDVAGMATGAGSPALAGHVARRSAAVVARLESAGAYVFAKAAMHELAFGATGAGADGIAPARNPHRPAHIAGGSSSGSAAAVAARLVPFALGSDTGGSVRVPAALCGVAGYRPTTGRYDSEGLVTISHTRDTIGPMAPGMDDLAPIDRVIAGSGDETIAGLSDLRLGVVDDPYGDPLDAAVRETIAEACARIEDQGAQLVPLQMPQIGPLVDQARTPILMHEGRRHVSALLESRGIAAADFLDAVATPAVQKTLRLILEGPPPSVEEYRAALEARERLREAFAHQFAMLRLDALLFPTVPVTAPKIDAGETVMLNGRSLEAFATLIRNTNPGSLAGLPGITVPAGLCADGLPTGLALDGPVGGDRRLIEIGRRIGEVLGRIPPPDEG